MRSPLSAPEAMARRGSMAADARRRDAAHYDYDLSRESFEIFVPRAYTGKSPFGLLVWISPVDTGSPPAAWLPVLYERRMIWAGLNGAGNTRAVPCREGLALDAAHNAALRFAVEPRRVYIGGASGGGRVSSRLGIAYPDVFTGGLYAIGCNYCRELPTGEPNRVWRDTFPAPPPDLLAAAKGRSRHVLLTGQTDFNRPQTLAIYRAMRQDGFQHVTYLEVAGMGHEWPNATWFARAIGVLDGTARVDRPAESSRSS